MRIAQSPSQPSFAYSREVAHYAAQFATHESPILGSDRTPADLISSDQGCMDSDLRITHLLRRANNGDDDALARLLESIYGQLRRIASSQRRKWYGSDRLHTTEIVHEAYLKLFRSGGDWQSRGHFYATASKAMRHILINQALEKNAAKRGGNAEHFQLSEVTLVADEAVEEVLQLEQALVKLEASLPRQSQVVVCRFFGGLDVDETAEALAISTATVKRDWRMARAWLYAELGSRELRT